MTANFGRSLTPTNIVDEEEELDFGTALPRAEEIRPINVDASAISEVRQQEAQARAGKEKSSIRRTLENIPLQATGALVGLPKSLLSLVDEGGEGLKQGQSFISELLGQELDVSNEGTLSENIDTLMGRLFQSDEPRVTLQGLPTAQEATSALRDLTGLGGDPQAGLEQAIESGVQFGTEAATLGGPRTAGKAIKTGGDLAKGLASRFAKSGAFSFVGDAAVQAGAPEITKPLLEAGSLFDLPKGRELVADLIKGDPKDPFRKELVRISESKGIDMPLSAVNENNVVNFAEQVLADNPLSKSVYDEMTQRISGQMLGEYESLLDRVSTSKVDAITAGENLQTAFRKAHQGASKATRSTYNAAKDIGSQTLLSAAESEPTVKRLGNLAKEIERNATSPEALSTAQIIKNNINKIKENAAKGDLTLADLGEVRREIRAGLKFGTLGGPKQLLKGAEKTLTSQIEKLGRAKNPDYVRAIKEADKRMADTAQIYRSNLGKSIMFGEVPELVIQSIRRPSDVKLLEKVLKDDLLDSQIAGKFSGVLDTIKRKRLEDLLAERAVFEDPARFKVGTPNLLGKKKNRELVRALAGEEVFKGFRDLEKLNRGIAQGAAKFENPSQTARKLTATDTAKFIINNTFKLLSEPGKAAGNLFTLGFAPKTVAKMLTDPEFIKLTRGVSKAGAGKDRKAYVAALNAFSDYTNGLIDQQSRDLTLPGVVSQQDAIEYIPEQ